MNKKQIARYLHFTMALSGGFLGAYTLFNHHDLFGNAQTSNLIYLLVSLMGKDVFSFLFRFADLAAYISGIACTVLIPKYTRLNLKLCSIIINTFVGIILCFIPSTTNDFLALCPVLFATAFQWNSFKGADGFTSSTIFSTNNLRQCVSSFVEFLCDKNQQHLRKAKFFLQVILFYHIGVVFSFTVYKYMGSRGGWLCILPQIAAFVLWSFENKWIEQPVANSAHIPTPAPPL